MLTVLYEQQSTLSFTVHASYSCCLRPPTILKKKGKKQWEQITKKVHVGMDPQKPAKQI